MLQIEVIGNLGGDAEIKEFNGKKYVSMNVAHSERYKGTDNTVWVSCLWYGDGGGLFQYLKKGVKVFMRGHLIPKAYNDKHGNAQIGLNMYANEVVLCGNKAEQQVSNQVSSTERNVNDLPF